MGMIVLADFTSPDCHLASRRADALTRAGVPLDWRAVQQRPELPVTGRRLAAADQQALIETFTRLQQLLLPEEELPWTMPAIQPRSDAAIAAFAEVSDTPVSSEVRRLLFELYWQQGVDIGNLNELQTPLTGPVLRAGSSSDPLRHGGLAVTLGRAPITTQAHRRITTWRAAWQELGFPALPVLLVGGATLSGMDALGRLGKEIAYAGAEQNPDLPEPRRYPHAVGRPSAAWVSQTGGRWRYAYRPGGLA